VETRRRRPAQQLIAISIQNGRRAPLRGAAVLFHSVFERSMPSDLIRGGRYARRKRVKTKI
jgi:hypothetical protein